MPDVFLDPRLPDYFVEYDWNEICSNDAARDSVFGDFLTEKICIVHGYGLGKLDLDFLRRVSLPQTWGMKKLTFEQLLSEFDNRAGEHRLLDFVRDHGFGGSERRLRRFTDQLRILKAIADEIVGRLLANLNVGHKNYVARFSETRMENLHFDIDKDSDSHDSFRLYINLDRVPRLWNTSYQLTELLNLGGQRLVQGLDVSLPGETLLKRVTARAFGGWDQRATERTAPRHIVFFDPGDVWLVDGRCVSHQVVTGHRVLSVYVRLPHSGNTGLGPTFADKLRTGIVKGSTVPLGSEAAQIEYFDQSKVSGPSNLKTDWANIFGQTGTGRVRRFLGSGRASP